MDGSLYLFNPQDFLTFSLTDEEIREYEKIIGHHIPFAMTYNGLRKRILRLNKEIFMLKHHKRGTTNERYRRGYTLDIKDKVAELIAVRKLREKVGERILETIENEEK